MFSKVEATDGGGKGVYFTKPKADGYHKRWQGRERHNNPTPARPTRLNFTGLT